MRIGLRHVIEVAPTREQVRTDELKEVEQVVVAELDRRRRQENHCLRVVAEVPDRPVGPGVGVSNMVCLVDDDEIECWWRIEIQEPLYLAALALFSQQEGFVE
jgi:hypothetical protein